MGSWRTRCAFNCAVGLPGSSGPVGMLSLKMGAVLAHRIAKPLGLNADRLLDAEREWFRC